MLSLVSAWEMQIKTQRGKLDFQIPLNVIVAEQQEKSGIVILPISLTHILDLGRLPDHHKDPFDRLLIAQARVEEAVLVTHDALISQYPIETIW